MPRSSKATPALDALSNAERAAALDRQLDRRPDLFAEAEAVATELLATVDRDDVADEVVGALLAVPFTAIAGRVGKQPGGGYVEPLEAAGEVLEETLEPYLDALRRTAAAGFADAATDIGFGLLLGLYRLREEAGDDTLIGWCGADQESWELATSVVLAFDDAGLDLGSEAVNALVPGWSGIA
ncbi:MAG: hypothetical protein ACR2KP_00230 [Egibacteraceae bacterium]